MTLQQIKDGFRAVSVPLFLALMSASNVFAFVFLKARVSSEIKASREALARSTEQVENLRVAMADFPSVLSNLVRRVSSAPPGAPSASPSTSPTSGVSPSQSLPVEKTIKYHYMVLDGYPAIRYYGRNFSIGSPFQSLETRIAQIFPDRIVLDDGTILVNSHNPDIDGAYFRDAVATLKAPANDRP